MSNLDNVGKLPTGLDYFHNLLSPPGPFVRLLKRKRKHAITVRKLSGWYGNFWKFSCTPCGLSINYPTWETAYRRANYHARNHH